MSGREPRGSGGGRLRTALATGSLFSKVLASFVTVLVLASLVMLLLETRLTREQLDVQSRTLFSEAGDVLDRRLSSDAARINQTMTVVAQSRFAAVGTAATPDDVDDRAAATAIVVRRAEDQLDLAGVVNVATGRLVPLALRSRSTFADPGVADARQVAELGSSTQRVVPLVEGGWAVAHVLPLERLADEPRLILTGYALDDRQARLFREETGVDHVELVVHGRVVASTVRDAGDRPSGDPDLHRVTQTLSDGRLARYVALGADRPWDTPAVIGLVSDDPLAALDDALTQTRVLMVLLLLVVGGALAYALAQVLTRPIARLTDTATAIAGGALDREFTGSRSDEIGQLGDALERMRRSLRTQVLVIGEQAEALQDAARRVVGERDRERQRIAQDLHDGIQQRLVVLRMQAGMLRSRLDESDADQGHLVQDLAVTIDQTLDLLRATAHALFPSILRDRGLHAALFSLAGRASVPLDLRFSPDPLPRASEEVEVNAFFIVSEAISNVLKHAEAGRILVEVSRVADVLRIRVTDDGRGFDPQVSAPTGGLVHLRDRANALGGTLEVLTAPGAGTTVTALLPVRIGAGDAGVDGSPGGPLQPEEDGGDPSVQVDVLAEAELAEDRVRVLLDRPLGDGQLPGDRRVPPS